jgi:hypothetical protein
MLKKITLWSTLSVGVLTLAIGASLASRAFFGAATTQPTVETGTANPLDLQATLQSILTEREAAYQAQLAQANRQLAAAYGQNQVQLQPTASPNVRTTAGVSAIQAVLLAAQATGLPLPADDLRLVDFGGVRAYEVSWSNTAVYIDWQTGGLLQTSNNDDAEENQSNSDHFENDNDSH